MKRVFISVALIPMLLFACSDQKIDTTKAREEMEAREIKVVSDAQILEEAMKLGAKLSEQFSISETKDSLSFNLGTDTVHQKAYYLFDEPNELNGKEEQLFEAYAYNKKNGLASEPNIQKLENGTVLLYTRPMVYKDSTIGMWSIKLNRKDIVLSIHN